MIKFSILLVVLFLTTTTTTIFAQTEFAKGFNSGYKNGYCFDQGVGCYAPNPPVSPILKIGESSDSFKDGYNRGFQVGKNSRSSKKSGERYNTSESKYVEDIIYQTPVNSTATYQARILAEADERVALNRIRAKVLKSELRSLQQTITKDPMLKVGLDEIYQTISNYERHAGLMYEAIEVFINKTEDYFKDVESYIEQSQIKIYNSEGNHLRIYRLKAKTELLDSPSEDFSIDSNRKRNVTLNYEVKLLIESEKNGYTKIKILEPDSLLDKEGWVPSEFILK